MTRRAQARGRSTGRVSWRCAAQARWQGLRAGVAGKVRVVDEMTGPLALPSLCAIILAWLGVAALTLGLGGLVYLPRQRSRTLGTIRRAVDAPLGDLRDDARRQPCRESFMSEARHE